MRKTRKLILLSPSDGELTPAEQQLIAGFRLISDSHRLAMLRGLWYMIENLPRALRPKVKLCVVSGGKQS